MKITEVNFTLRISNNHVRIHEGENAASVEFRAKGILESEWVADMVAESLCNRFKEIVIEHLKQ